VQSINIVHGVAPRIVVVSSHSHYDAKRVDFERLFSWSTIPVTERAKLYSGLYGTMKLYMQAKLANVLFVNELHRRYGAQIDTAALHPGNMIQTDIVRSNPVFRAIFWIISPFTKTLDQVSYTWLDGSSLLNI
jgi:WW domain-containing oxidoreductase